MKNLNELIEELAADYTGEELQNKELMTEQLNQIMSEDVAIQDGITEIGLQEVVKACGEYYKKEDNKKSKPYVSEPLKGSLSNVEELVNSVLHAINYGNRTKAEYEEVVQTIYSQFQVPEVLRKEIDVKMMVNSIHLPFQLKQYEGYTIEHIVKDDISLNAELTLQDRETGEMAYIRIGENAFDGQTLFDEEKILLLEDTEPFDDGGEYLRYDKWTPKEEEKPRILKKLVEDYIGTKDLCGVDSEEADEVWELYKKVFQNKLEDCKEDIQQYFADAYLAVNGQIHKYYENDNEIIELIQLTVL